MCIRPVRSSDAAVVSGRYETPWGTGWVSVSGGLLVGVELPGAAAPAAAAVPAPSSAPAIGTLEPDAAPAADEAALDAAALERWVGELEAYFRGERLGWSGDDVSLDGLTLGPFERAVYRTLLSIPPAVTVSYGTLAELAGYPRAARAVGNAMAANPIPVVVPCHRVIRADGSLGNYGDDPAWKERLLAHERAHAPAAGREEDR
jgi:methylated-DNA-[protein]-cysteine S-methyltransferase